MLEVPMLELERKTGISIDPYGTTILYNAHVKLLNSLILDFEDTLTMQEKKSLQELIKKVKVVLEHAIDTNINICIEGD